MVIKKGYSAVSIPSGCLGEVSLSLLAPVCVCLLLVMWSGHSVMQVIDVTNTHLEAESVVDVQPPSSSPLRRQPLDINTLAAIPLFGEVEKNIVTETAPIEKEEPVEETKLNLILKGLFTAGEDSGGQAIVANGRDEQLYQVGDAIEGLSNVSLSAVLVDSIRLKNRGKTEVLYLYPEGERTQRSSSDNDAAAYVPDTLDEQAVQSELVNDSNATKLSEIIRVVRERNKETGDMIGFRVLPGRNRGAFDKSGLLANDVITSIDGEKLNDLRSAMNVYRNKRDVSQVSLMVNRDGSEISLDIDLSSLP
ncbi:type II secretion system protein N [Eionea flava]